MTTLAQAHGGPDASYHGDRGHWQIVYTITRDASILDRANWDAILRMLNNAGDGWAIETSGHWAVGHIQFIVVDPAGEYRGLPEQIRADLEEYPVLDEELHSDMETEATLELWDAMSMRERVDILRDQGYSIFTARCSAGNLYDYNQDAYYYIQMLATE